MIKKDNLLGQWVGHFTYGPEYGPELHGEKVTFRLFINSQNRNGFTGKCIDLDGVGANYEVAEVEGFIKDNFISFTKQYPHFFAFDENGNSNQDKKRAHPLVSYEGFYDAQLNLLKGNWEMSLEIEPLGDGWLEDVCTGYWEAEKDEEI